jgi:tetratricopeptide (TPR) repeat protein
LNPFADISSQSHFQEELEILFMIGCRFEIQDIYYDENEKYWLVKMGLVYAYHRQDYRIYENMSDTTFRRTLIYCVSKLSISVTRASEQDINILFNELIDLFPAEEKWISAIKSQCLAGHKFNPKSYHTEPITYFEQALKIWNDYIEDDEFNCLTIIGEIHKQMGVWYEIRHPTDKNLAITHCDLAISYMKSAIERTQTDYERIETLNRLASIYDCKMNISNNIKENAMMCIKYLQLAIQEMLKYYSKHDYMIISRVKDLAEYLVLVDKYDDALLNYRNVLDIYLQQPKPPSGWIDNVYKNMVNIYIKYKHDYDSGLRYQLFSHEYTLKSQMQDRIYDIDYNNYKKDNMAISYEKLSVIYMKLGQYNLAYTNLMIAMKLHEEMLQSSDTRDTICKMAKTKVELADISVKLHQYDLAFEHLESAIRLCEGRSRLYHENIKIANIYVKLANSYTELQEYDLVDENLARALNIYRNYNDSQYEFKGRVTRLVNGRIKRCKRSATIVYIAKYDHIRTYIIAFLDNKITALSHRLVYDEIRRVYKRHK